MPKITFVNHAGGARIVEVPVGWSVMEGAVWNNIGEVLADCGGDCGCATCHVYVEDNWAPLAGTPNSKEKSTLRFALNVKRNSRLSCQIRVTSMMDGFVVHLPERQF